ncbi:hypothetical protein KM043_005934 [Ampulex compressa]|nr:hypothetical protein KM043_005934 [Ampulex compressa]
MSVYDGYQQDVNYITEQCRFVLRIIGIWPVFEEKIPFTTRIAKTLAMLASYISLLCNVIPGILYYVYGREPDPRVRLKHAVAVIYACMTVAKYSSLVFHEDDIKGCFGHVKEDWKMLGGISYRECMMERVRSGRQLFVFCGSCMYISGMSYSTVVPLSRGKIVVDENTTIRPFSYPTYFIFFDEQKSPAYEIVFFIQVFAGFVSYTITTALCGLAALFVMHSCAQLEILEELMNDLTRKETLKDYLALDTLNGKLAVAVEHHVRVRNFVRMVEMALQESSLIEIVGCTSIICLLGYCALMEWEDGNTVAVCSFLVSVCSLLFTIFVLCYVGDQLTTQAEKVSRTSCTLEWYRISDKKVRLLVLIMAMSNSSIQIQAGKFIPLSFKTFGDIIKTSAAYFNMLRTVTE